MNAEKQVLILPIYISTMPPLAAFYPVEIGYCMLSISLDCIPLIDRLPLLDLFSPLLTCSHLLFSKCDSGRWVGSVQSRVVGSVGIKYLENNRTIALSVVACGGSHSPIATMVSHLFVSGRNVLSRERSLKHLQCSQGLIERYFVSRFVYSHEAVQVALPDLTMNDSVRSGDVDKSCLFVSRGIDFFCDDLAPEPIAVEVTRKISAVSFPS